MTKTRQKGFTLTEVIVAIVIVALVFTAAFMLLSSGNNVIYKGERRDRLAIEEKSLMDQFTYDTTYFNNTYIVEDNKTSNDHEYRLNYSDVYQTYTKDTHNSNYYILVTETTDTSNTGYTLYTITLQGYYQGATLGTKLEREVRVYA